MIEFFILGDMGSGEESQKKVAIAMKKKIKEKDTFICGLGDNIYEKGVTSVNDPQFQEKFEEPYKDVNVPFYMCLGNHDYGYSNRCLIPKKNAFHQVKYSNYSEKWNMPFNYYNFDKEDENTKISFFVLDTNLDMMNPKEIEDQKNTMINKIKNSDSNWKIVYGHHTLRSVGGHGNADDDFEQFMIDLFTQAPFDVYMCGHDHNKQILRININNKPLLLIVCGTGGKEYHKEIYYNNLAKKDCELECCSGNLGYGQIIITDNLMNIYFFDEKNKKEYSCKYLKEQGLHTKRDNS